MSRPFPLTIAWLVFLGATASTIMADEREDRRQEAATALKSKLQELPGAEHGELSDVQADVLDGVFPECDFFVLRFPRYPVAIEPTPPLHASNLFAVRDGEVVQVSDEEQLAEFFKEHSPATREDAARTELTKSWFRLAQELHQDGYYDFKDPDVQITDDKCGGRLEAVTERGNKGELTVTLEFDDDGKLTEIAYAANLLPGVRPKCQALRLLDADPQLREIMRRDLLVMGRACQPYLEDVRKTADPELQRAIDDVWRQIVAEGR